MSDHIIRPVAETDAATIASIYEYHVLYGTATFDTVPLSIEETRKKIADIALKQAPFLVVEQDDAVVGYAYTTNFRDRAAYSFACENSIYIHPQFAGQGIGRALLAALLQKAEDCGFLQMIAVIGGGEPASVALHASAGFAHAGRMKSVGRKFGQWLDTVYMQRALGQGDSVAPPSEPPDRAS